MKTNFFEQVAGMQINGNLLLNIQMDENKMLTVSAILKKGNITATAGNDLPSMLFNGTAQELDEGFFAAIASPLKITSGLITNLESYQKEVEKAGKQAKDKSKPSKTAATAMDEDNDDEESPDLFKPQADDKEAKAEKKRLYDEQMDKVKKLARDMKYTEALTQLPDEEEYPDKAETIAAKRKEIETGKEMYDKLQNQFND